MGEELKVCENARDACQLQLEEVTGQLAVAQEDARDCRALKEGELLGHPVIGRS